MVCVLIGFWRNRIFSSDTILIWSLPYDAVSSLSLRLTRQAHMSIQTRGDQVDALQDLAKQVHSTIIREISLLQAYSTFVHLRWGSNCLLRHVPEVASVYQ